MTTSMSNKALYNYKKDEIWRLKVRKNKERAKKKKRNHKSTIKIRKTFDNFFKFLRLFILTDR